MYKFLLQLAACGVLMASCAEESENAQIMQGKVKFEVPDFEEEASADTRMNVSVTSSGATFKWSEGDTLGVFPDEGYQTAFPISDGSGTSAAEFDGGAWALRDLTYYAAYYPLQHPMETVDKSAVSVHYLGQKQTGNNKTTHLGAYDFLAAPFTRVSSTGGTTFKLAHIGALVRLRLYVPAADAFSRLTLTSDGAPFVTSGTIDLTAANPTLTPTATSDKMTLDLSDISSEEADDLITLYVMMAPADQSSTEISVRLSGSKAGYIGSVSGKNMQAGTIYGYSLELEETEFSLDDPVVENPLDNPEEEDSHNGHKYVDLGLPSGLKWATENIGGDNYYFAWGETSIKQTYSWETYKYYDEKTTSMTKYNGRDDEEFVLMPEDDAATAFWGGSWRMPTLKDWKELLANCTYVINNSTITFTSKVNNKTLSLSYPSCSATINGTTASFSYYWSSSLYKDDLLRAYCIGYNNFPYVSNSFRCIGGYIRAVCP